MSKKYYHKFDETAARRFVSLFIDTLLIKNNPGSLISSLHSTIITSDLIANESKISSVLPTLDPKEFLTVYMHLLLYPVLYQNLLSNKVCIALNNILTEHLGSFSLYYMNLNTSSKELEAEFNISDNNIMDFIFDGSHLSKNSLSILSDALIPQLLLSIYNVYKNKKIPYKDANYVPSLTASMAVDEIAESFSHFISMFGPEYLSAFFALLFINILFPNKPTNLNSSFFKVSLNPAHTNYAKKLATMVNIKDLLKILSNKFFVLMKVKSTENFIFEILFQMSYFLDGDVSLNKISEHIPIENITKFIEFTDLMYQSLPEGNISQLNSGLTSTIVYSLLEFVEKNDPKNQKEPGNEPSALTAFMESNCFAQLIVSAYLNVDKKILDSAKGQEFVNSVKNFIKSHPHVLPEYIGGTLFYQDTNYRNEQETLNLWSECMIATENFDRLHLIVSNKFKDEEQKKKIFNLFFSMLPFQSVECITRVNITLSKFAYADLTLIDGTYDYFKAQCMFLAATANTDAIKKKIMNEITQLHNKYNVRVGEATYKQRAHYAELANMFKAFIDVLTISQRSFGDKSKKPLVLDPSIANIIIGLVSNYLLTSYNTKSKEFNMLANLFANEICTNYPELPFEVVHGPNAQDYQSVSNDFYKQLYSTKDGLEACMNTVQKYYFSKYHDGHAIYAHIIGEIAYETPFFIKDYPKPAMKTIGMFIAKMIETDLFRGIQLDVFKVILALNTVEVKNDSVPFYHAILSALGEKLKTAPAYSIKRDKFILSEIIKKGNLANLIPGLTATLNGSSESENESKNSPSNQVVPVDGLVKPRKPFNFVNPSDVNLPERITIDMSFILNNVSNNNVQESAHNLRMILNNAIDNGSGVLETLAKLFTQRIKQDSNYHVVYRDLIYAMNVKPLLDDITYNVLTSVSTLFSHSASSSKDKKLLKTLANWLGLSLIAKNKILTNEELPIRELLLDSWNKGYTQSSVPFVCTIIEYTKDSSLFQYPNLWTKSIIELLVEMKETGDNTKDANKWALKTTFNVEVMFKNLKLSMLDVGKSNWLSNPDSLDILTGKISHESNDIKNSEKMLQNLIQRPVMEMMMAQKVQQVNNGVANMNIDEQIISSKPQQQMNMQMPQQQQMNMQMPQQQAQLPHNDAILTSLQGNTMFVANPDLQVAFQMAIAKSVREILVTVVEKSSTTAAMTARALVAKDFATEANPELYKATCVKTARQLAKSSTYINSASMLRSNIVNTTRQLCGNVMILLQNVEEELVTAIDDNIDMAISIIENAAMDKATTLVLDAIIPDISFRQHHVQRRSGQAFHYVPEGVVTSASIPLPDAFKLNPEGITKQQLSVYESLENMPLGTDMHLAMNNSNNSSSTMVPQPLANNVSSQPMNAKSSSASDRQSLLQQLNKVKNSNQQESVNMAAPPMMNNQPPPGFGQRPMQGTSVQGTPMNQPQQMMMPEAMNEQMQRHQNTMFMTFEQQLVSSMNMIDAVVGYIYDSRDRNLDDVITVVDAFVIRIISGIANSKQLNAIALAVSQTCVSRMFEFRGNQLVVVVFTTLIQKLCIMSPVAKKDVNWWLVHSQNSLKMDTTCLLILNKIGVLETSQFDTLLSGLLKSDIKNTIDFTLDVLKNLFELKPFEISKTQLAYTITLLKQVEDDFYKEKIDAFFNSKEYASLTVQSEDEIHTVLFTEWANLLETYQPSDLVCRKFLVELMQNLPTTEKFISFLNMALKISYDAFLVSDPQSNVFKAIDALAYLVVQLVIYQNSAMGVNRSKFLSVVLVAFQSKLALHANDKQFNGRPFFRFVSVILSYWQQLYVAGFDMVADENVRTELLEFNKELYTVITDMLHICQPMFFPSFSFSWLGLFSHRMYLPIMLKFEGEAKSVMWKKLNLLLIDLFRFLKVFGKNGDESIKVLNAGILRIILFVANDCPEFLIENHYVLMNELPGDFKQIRNIINSCIPQGKIFPDALNQFVNIDVIDESCNFSPKALVSPVNDLGSLKKPLDSFLRIPSSSLNRNIMNQIAQLNNGDAKENFKVINAIVTHSVILAGDELLSTSKQVILNESSSYFNLISNLITSNVVENRAVVMNVIDSLVNHLRFPNTQTYFVWYVLTTIFNIDLNDKELTKKLNWNEESLAIAQEMILRSLLDRLLVSKPHPWGCVMTIMTILKKIDNVDELKFVNKSKNGNESVYGLMTAMKSVFESANKEVEVQ